MKTLRRLSRLSVLALAFSCESERPLPFPVISSFSPISGPLGTEITISGSNFASTLEGNKVKINGAPVTILSASTGSLKVSVDHGVSSGKLTVETNDQTATSNEEFRLSCLILSNIRTTTTDSIGWAYSYNEKKQVSRVDCPLFDFYVIYEYDEWGRLSRETHSIGGIIVHTDFHYNINNLVTHTTVPQNGDSTSETFHYNDFGQVIQADNPLFTKTFEYPNSVTRNPSSSTIEDGSTSQFEYDSNPNPFFVAIPWHPLQTENNQTRLEVSSGPTVLTSYTYNHSGYPRTAVETTVGSGSVSVTWSYDCDY